MNRCGNAFVVSYRARGIGWNPGFPVESLIDAFRQGLHRAMCRHRSSPNCPYQHPGDDFGRLPVRINAGALHPPNRPQQDPAHRGGPACGRSAAMATRRQVNSSSTVRTLGLRPSLHSLNCR